jgi:protein gp37
MADKSAIEWTDATWNPTTGCDRVSPGCAHCYALDLAGRLKTMGAPAYQRDGDPQTSGPGFGLTLHPDRLELPLRWTKPRRIFVDSMSDLFHPEVSDAYIAEVFGVMAAADQHVFQVLTKRPERMHQLLGQRAVITHEGWQGWWWKQVMPAFVEHRLVRDGGTFAEYDRQCYLRNVWLGTSVENARWTTRIDELRSTPAAVRFLSCEPLLGDLGTLDLTGIDWVITGGESGPDHRPIDPDWVRSIRDQCQAVGVAFFHKQWGGRTPKSGGRELDGRTWDEMPRQLVPA